eukprot:7279678-Lingulodinium_polyedra.AAC.1
MRHSVASIGCWHHRANGCISELGNPYSKAPRSHAHLGIGLRWLCARRHRRLGSAMGPASTGAHQQGTCPVRLPALPRPEPAQPRHSPCRLENVGCQFVSSPGL